MGLSGVLESPRFKPRMCPIAAGHPHKIDAILAFIRVASSLAFRNSLQSDIVSRSKDGLRLKLLASPLYDRFSRQKEHRL